MESYKLWKPYKETPVLKQNANLTVLHVGKKVTSNTFLEEKHSLQAWKQD